MSLLQELLFLEASKKDPHDVEEMSVLQRMKYILKTKHGYTDADFEEQTFADIESMFLDDAGEKDFRGKE